MIHVVGVKTTFCEEEGILLQKHCDRNGRCVARLFTSIEVRGRFHSPDVSDCTSAWRSVGLTTQMQNAALLECLV